MSAVILPMTMPAKSPFDKSSGSGFGIDVGVGSGFAVELVAVPVIETVVGEEVTNAISKLRFYHHGNNLPIEVSDRVVKAPVY